MPKAHFEPSCPLSSIGDEEVQTGGSLYAVRIYALHLLTHGPILFSNMMMGVAFLAEVLSGHTDGGPC
jgi:hypothetical protein